LEKISQYLIENHVRVRTCELPPSVRGFCCHDKNGQEYIYINSNLTKAPQLKTLRHEGMHLIRGEMYDADYNEY
jgi:Zn-dependent peptidase ImmA (M78 family)